MDVWILSDGRPGHFNQSKGMVLALRRNYEVAELWIEARARSSVARSVMRALLNGLRGRMPLGVLRALCRLGELPPRPPELLVSAGGNTCHANAWLARHFNCRNLFCGTLRGLRAELFSGVVTYEAGREKDDRFILGPTPVAVEKEAVEEEGRKFRDAATLGEARLWTLLVGGEGAGYAWTKADWNRLAQALARMSADHGVRWVVVTSRRTGAEGDEMLAAAVDPKAVAAATYVTGVEEVSYAAALGCAERIFCTEDSHMMITEGMAAGRPVHTLQPAAFETDPSNQQFLTMYEQRRFITRHRVEALAKGPFEVPSGLEVQERPGVDQLAGELNAWWEKG